MLRGGGAGPSRLRPGHPGAGADDELLALLEQALADRIEVDIAWDESLDEGASDRRGPYR
jgi:hypothetical protein